MNKQFSYLIVLLLFLVTWELIVKGLHLPTYLVPSIESVFKSFEKNWPLLLSNWSITIIESAAGFILANLISGFLAILVFRFSLLENIILPYAIVLKTVPIIALAPLLILWFGSGFLSHIMAVILVCFFPSLVNLIRGIKSIDPQYLDLFIIYNASFFQKLKLLIIPSSLPFLFASLKISSSLSIIGALISEFITANKGLGFIIITGYYTLDIPLVFSAIILSSLTGILFYLVISYLESLIVTWTDPID